MIYFVKYFYKHENIEEEVEYGINAPCIPRIGENVNFNYMNGKVSKITHSVSRMVTTIYIVIKTYD